MSRHPILYRTAKSRDIHQPIIVKRLIKAANSAATIVDTRSNDGVFRGRGADHHCHSSFFMEMTMWLRSRFRVAGRSAYQQTRKRVTWLHRIPFKVNHQRHIPSIRVKYLPLAIRTLNRSLDPRYELHRIYPEQMKVREIIEQMSASDVFIAAHGAGNTWLIFMPPGSYFIELFGGDRGPANRHYHNLASLVGVNHRQIAVGSDGCQKSCIHKLHQLLLTCLPT